MNCVHATWHIDWHCYAIKQWIRLGCFINMKQVAQSIHIFMFMTNYTPIGDLLFLWIHLFFLIYDIFILFLFHSFEYFLFFSFKFLFLILLVLIFNFFISFVNVYEIIDWFEFITLFLLKCFPLCVNTVKKEWIHLNILYYIDKSRYINLLES